MKNIIITIFMVLGLIFLLIGIGMGIDSLINWVSIYSTQINNICKNVGWYGFLMIGALFVVIVRILEKK